MLCTTKPQRFAERIVAHFGLAQFLDGIYGTTPDGRFDDKADLIAHLLASEGFAGEKCLMIGDRMHDIRAARQNRVDAVGVLWGYGSSDELEQAGATRLYVTPPELSRALDRIQAASS